MTFELRKQAANRHPAFTLIQKDAPDWHGGMTVVDIPFNCCGLGALEGFGYNRFADWKQEAEWVSALYRHKYSPGHIMYCITDAQLYAPEHRALLNIGAKQLAEFPNLTHGNHILSVWLVNIRDACGRYCNKYGEAYAEPPKDGSEINDDLANKVGGILPRKG